MTCRMLASAIAVAGATQGISLLSGAVAAQGQNSAGGTTKWTVARTAWGDPDLQGRWTNTTTTPLERPSDLAGKQALTPQD